ncbi:MAG: GNAT family N-acetyltransferase [Bacteroidetes bacterium]|nr:GNAT family N-acetyltransferase [Bacteroidota bacterium]
MDIEVRRFSQQVESEWDQFVSDNNRNATFLHLRKFFNHNPLNQEDDASLMFYKKNKLISVLPAAIIEQASVHILNSHPRSTYGGYVLHDSVGVKDAVEIVDATVAFAADHQIDEIVIRNPFRIFHSLPSDETDFAMWHHGFTLKYREIESVILLGENTRQYYDDSTLRSIKKSNKLVQVMPSDDWNAFWNILEMNLTQKYHRRPTHSLEDFNRLQSLLPDGLVKLFAAYEGDNMIAGIVVFLANKKCLHAQYIASDSNYQHLRPLNAIIDYVVNWGVAEKFTYLNLGTSNEQQGRFLNEGLFRFKEGFGAKGILREAMHLTVSHAFVNHSHL